MKRVLLSLLLAASFGLMGLVGCQPSDPTPKIKDKSPDEKTPVPVNKAPKAAPN